MIKVKICGINDARAFDAAVEAGADWLGFVFYPPSPRYVRPEEASALSRRVSGGPPRVGLFVDPSIQDVGDVLKGVHLDALQVYGASDRYSALASTFGLPIWRPVGVRTMDNLPTGSIGEARLVIEAEAPPDASRPGGNAVTFDWSIMKDWIAPCPWMLAGGLTPENVGVAIRMTGAEAVDVSSGVEMSKGVKDPARITAFIAAARHAGAG